MRKLIFVVTVMLSSSFAYANDTSFGGSGASPMPIRQNNVRMMSEHIVIQGKNIASSEGNGEWRYRCDYTFRNETNRTINLEMGFPFPVYDPDDGDIAVPKGRVVKKQGALVHDFSVTINGQPIVITRRKIQSNEKLKMYYKDAYLWPMHFLPHQTVVVHHDYITGVTINSMGFSWVDYVLRTGGLWHGGVIGYALLEVIPNTPTRLCSELLTDHPNPMAPKPAGIKIFGKKQFRRYVWDLKRFSPTEDLRLCLQTGRHYIQHRLVYQIEHYKDADNTRLQNMSLAHLALLRNTIFAQYGRQFKNIRLQHYFDRQWWYVPNPHYSSQMLTKADKDAIALITKIEAQKKH